MTFSDTTTKNGAIQECETWLFGNNYGSISDNSDLLLTFTRLLNYGLDQTEGEIYKTDGKWNHDDNTNPNLPIATTALNNGISNYTLDKSQLKIHAVEILNSKGIYIPVFQTGYQEIRHVYDKSETDFLSPAGLPKRYDLVGDQLILFPAPSTPDVTLAAGLRVIYQREPNYFVSTDTTKEFGIPRMFHDVPVLFACSKYAKSNSTTEKSNAIDSELARRIADIRKFFNTRDADVVRRMVPAGKRNIYWGNASGKLY